MKCTQKLEGNAIYRNEYTETEQNRICRNIHACSKPDLDDHWSYKWLFLSEELWVVLFVDVHVIVGEHCLTFFFSISIQKDANNHAEGLLQKVAMRMYLI
jgi:hypothetical protein